MDRPLQVQDKAPKPQGLLPKNVQSWLLIGLAFLMVAIMWLTGGKKPVTPGKAPSLAPAVPAPVEVDQTKISELQSRIEELQRQQLVAENALAQQTRLLGAAALTGPPSVEQAMSVSSSQQPEDPVQAERKRRAYLALFASNVALSYRPTSQKWNDTRTNAVRPEAQGSPIDAQRQPPEARNGAGRPDSSPADAGKTYILFEGTVLESVLINRLDGQFAGPVECLLSTDVYSTDRQHLLIPAGSKLLGEAKKVDTFGQTRLAVMFHRLLMPDGYSVSLDRFVGLNQPGDTGLRDQVNNHYLRIFGVSLAIGALGAVAEAGTSNSLTASSADLMRQGFAESTAQSSAEILDKFLNIMPTVTIREGHRVKVYLAGDLALPDYNNHNMPPDL
jgi:type IV secretion system protein TrbI